MVDDSFLPHIEKIQSAHHVFNLQREEIDKQNTIIQTLQDKLDKVEERVEEQENNCIILYF
jgi:GTPase involved in cell partitioning and DNA repair